MDQLPFQEINFMIDGLRVQVCLLSVSCLEDNVVYRRALALVSPWREEKILKYRQDKDRRLSLGAGLVMEKCLQYYGLHEKDMVYQQGPHEKPMLAMFPHIHFNLSHSGEMVMGGFSSREIGCDIEQIQSYRESISRNCFHPDEYRYLSSLSEDRKAFEFYRLWTLKESYMKLTGDGLSLPMKDFRICLSGPELWGERNGSRIPARFLELPVEGYCASLAVKPL